MKVINVIGAVAVAMTALMLVACIALVINLSRLNALADSILEPVQYATEDRWYSDEPPAGEEILGLWYDGTEARSHVVIKAMGMYYPARIGEMKPIEIEAPVYWRRLP